MYTPKEMRSNINNFSSPLAAQIEINSDPVGDEWPMFHGSLNHTGQAGSSSMVTGGLRWKYTTMDGIDSSPAVVGDRVYFGSNDNNTYCLNATTGDLIWNYTTGASVYSSPAVAGGNLIRPFHFPSRTIRV